MGRPTKEVQEYNRALFEQGLIKCSTCKDIKSLDDFGNRTDMWNGKRILLWDTCNTYGIALGEETTAHSM